MIKKSTCIFIYEEINWYLWYHAETRLSKDSVPLLAKDSTIFINTHSYFKLTVELSILRMAAARKRSATTSRYKNRICSLSPVFLWGQRWTNEMKVHYILMCTFTLNKIATSKDVAVWCKQICGVSQAPLKTVWFKPIETKFNYSIWLLIQFD